MTYKSNNNKTNIMIKLLIAILLFYTFPLSANEHPPSNNKPESQAALNTLKRITSWTWEEEVSALLQDYNNIDYSSINANYVINDLNMHRWGQKITDFLDLATLLLSFQSEQYQKSVQLEFDQAKFTINSIRYNINQIVLSVHPSFDLNNHELKNKYKGSNVNIAVFDLFDPLLLEKQIEHYPSANIEAIQNFGDPVQLNHGNSVIDIILAIAPQATIIPISAESNTYHQAMTYLESRTDIHVINMSRAFSAVDNQLDPQFSQQLSNILSRTIVTKSLGNTGTDLDENVTPLRQSLDLEATGNLFSYDLALIKEFLPTINTNTDNLLLAINLDTFAHQIALSATIPGHNTLAISRSLSIPADAVYTWSTGNFESGSSFAAPQLAAISALLWQAYLENHPQQATHGPNKVAQALKINTRPSDLGSFNTGLGLVDADKALEYLLGRQ
ncbi:S8 family serine peptidase [Vibrio ostreicida]|uniref:S8 family serine peptidase n=1 Tax=Vibrio ostreicida TaxID=526588 RepID=A0ABT8BYK0_9VIBR|nr:S8 family serine peptidase [Vibrio ostreicida]MDN3611449.1 S8 family serine peptidase [Vibrio ostreicida]NPD08952.1 S8 family serine peptidase [Vibrio ostreicida]